MQTNKNEAGAVDIKWQLAGFRASVFFKDDRAPTSVWEQLFETSPKDVTSKPLQKYIMEEGEVNSSWIRLISKSNRSDLHVIPIAHNEIGTIETPAIGNYADIKDEINKIVISWLGLQSNVIRVAQAVSLANKIINQKEGYEILAKLLPNIKLPDPDNSSEFTYKVNRYKTSKNQDFKNLRINRLASWQCIEATTTFKQGNIEISQSALTPFIVTDIDVNTDNKNKKTISKKNLIEFYKELDHIAQETSIKGDIE